MGYEPIFKKKIDNIFDDSGYCFIIAEVGQAHDGSLGIAHSYIDAVAKTGVDAIKFQTHIAAAESSDLEDWRTKFSHQDKTRTDYWRRMEFTKEQWIGLKLHAEDLGLIFLSSPFSLQAVELLDAIGMPLWKIASGEVTNDLLIDNILSKGNPIILSSGMSSFEDLDLTVAHIRAKMDRFAIMQCTTSYPCPPTSVGLNLISEFKQRYGCPVGLSDHSSFIFPGLSATTLGARLLEVHVTFSKEMFGPDCVASLTLDELKFLTEGVRMISEMLCNPVQKNLFATNAADLKTLFGQALTASRFIPAGTLLALEHLSCKKPCAGIPAREYKSLIGKKTLVDLNNGQFLQHNDIEK